MAMFNRPYSLSGSSMDARPLEPFDHE